MKSVCKVIFPFAVLAFWSSSAWPQAAVEQEPSLGDIARHYRGNKKADNPCPPTKPCDGSNTLSQVGENQAEYEGDIQTLLARRDFAGLDDAGENDRSLKTRVKGGAWKLYLLYDVVSKPSAGDKAKDSDWGERLALLKDWMSARPASVTARVALAQCYYNYGWVARGDNYADKVTDEGWKSFDARLNQASDTLAEAEKLPTKCPHWYFLTLAIARSQGWPKAKARNLFESAIAFEPSYYHYYREFANNFLAKWSGAPGEAEAFAEESARRLGGREGSFVYFEIASLIYCPCGGEPPARPALSWPKIQEGFAVLESEYGVTNLKLNRYVAMAYLYQDAGVAREIFGRIGDNPDPTVWRGNAEFDSERQWAASQVPGPRKTVGDSSQKTDRR